MKTAARAETANVTDETEKRRAEKAAKFPRVFAARMLPALAATMTGRAIVEVPLPMLPDGARGFFASSTSPNGFRMFVAGDRLFYREWNGGPTGRADLLTILGFPAYEDADGEPGAKAGNWARCYRSFGWSRGKVDDDLSELSLVVVNRESDGPAPLVTI